MSSPSSSLWWTVSVRLPDGSSIAGSGYSPIEAGQDLQKQVGEQQAAATRAQEHAADAVKALDVLGAILLPEPLQPPSPAPPVTP